MADDLETQVTKLRKELSEFMTDESITNLEKNAVEETQLALEMFPKQTDAFYETVKLQAELDRYSRAKKLCLDYLRASNHFYGFTLGGDGNQHIIDSRDEASKKVDYLSVEPFTEEQMKNRLNYHWKTKGGKKK